MPFKHKELADHIDQGKYKKGDGEEGAWVFVVGCAPGSARCPDNTQNGAYALEDELGHYQLDLNAEEAAFNIAFLKKALKDKISELEVLEQGLIERGKRREAAASRKGPDEKDRK